MSTFNGSDALNRHLAEHPSYDDFLCHHGILGQKWGIRRYQNPDGTLTEEGKKTLTVKEKVKRMATLRI